MGTGVAGTWAVLADSRSPGLPVAGVRAVLADSRSPGLPVAGARAVLAGTWSPGLPVAGPARPWPAFRWRPIVESVEVAISSDAADFVRRRGGRLWVWAAYGRLCCAGSPPWMHAATEPPPGLSGFSPVPAGGVQVWFRGIGSLRPEVLEIGLRGRRRPKVAAYWDGCLMAMV